MTTTALAAVLLGGAALLAPASPRRGLSPQEPRLRIGGRPLAGSVVAAVVAGLAVTGLASSGAALAGGAAAVIVADRRRRRRRQRRQRDEGRAVAAALEVLAGELRVGAHPIQAFDVAAEESGGVVGGSLRAVASRARLGADVPAGLREMADHSAVPVYWERMAVCWQLAADHGLAISVLMRAAQRDIVDRQRFADRVEAGSAGARATAAILAGMPMIGVLLGQLVGAHPLRFLFGAGPGGWILAVGVVLIGLGVTWSDRIIDQGAR
ncbi:MAG: type II secretion system F family protein [Mycobacterium sp.]|nr:type II secretion system F family protein [Mycobacterium sp.]